MRHTCARVLAVVAFAGLLSHPATIHTQGLPSQAKYKGLTHGEWTAVWWQTALTPSTEAERQAWFNGGVLGEKNRTLFMAPPVLPEGSPKVTIPVTIQPGTSLFFPIITVECSEAEPFPFHGDGEIDLRACANGLLDLVSDPYAEIDGRPVTDPSTYRVDSPLFRYGPLPEDSFLGLPPGTQSDSVGAGYFLLLRPLSVGEHRISVRTNVPAFGIAVDAEFIINVEPPRGR